MKTSRLSFIKYFLLAAGLLGAQIAYSQKPTITSFEPTKGFYGEVITIKGSGFANKTDMLVRFGTSVAKITESNATTIKVRVPAGASYAPISVTNLLPSGLTAYTRQPFLLSFGGQENAIPAFAPFSSYAGTNLFDVCTCDLDGDGLNDMVGSNQASTSTTAYLNSSAIGNLNFLNRIEISAGSRTNFLSCGDLDGDGKMDLIFTGHATDGNKVIMLRNTSSAGSISFAPPQVLSVPNKSFAKPAIQDLDLDGKAEIVLTDLAGDQLIVFKNASQPGSISFNSNPLSFPLPAPSNQGLRIKDLNKDGLADITVSNLYGNKVYFLINNSSSGNISFQAPTEFNASFLANHELEDLDGDGKEDLITLDYLNNKANIYLNNSTGSSLSFGETQSFATGNRPTGLQLGDINGDKKVDLLVGHNLEAKAYLFINTSTEGSLSFEPVVLAGNGKFTNVQLSDMDGDAKPDVVAADKEFGFFYVFRNLNCLYPSVNPSGTVQLCGGSSVTLSTVQSPLAELATPLIEYKWLKDGAPVGIGHSLTVSAPGNYSVELISTAGCGASSNSVSVSSSSGGTGNPAFAAISPLCQGESLTLSVSPAVEGGTYTWTNEATGFTKTTNTNSLNIPQADAALHTGTITLVIAKSSCEISVQSPEIFINAKPTATVTVDGPLSLCAGESTLLRTAEGHAQYQWKKNGNAISSTNSATYTASEPGSYSVVVSNTNGCKIESEAIDLEVSESLQAAFDAPETACLGQPVKFKDQSDFASGETVKYLWDFGDGTTSTNPSPTHTYSNTGSANYTVNLSIQIENSSCSSTSSRNIQVISSPAISIEAAGPAAFCLGDSVKVQIVGDVSEVSWSNGDSGPFTYAKTAGSLFAEVLTAGGCSQVKTIEIESLAAPELEVTADKKELGRGGSAQLQASGAISYQWEPAESLDNPTIANPIASPKETTTYKVTALGENGCSAEMEITIEVGDSFTVQTPKLFVPATDQYWKVTDIENFPDFSLTIINKFGAPVFETSSYENNWDGTDKGNELKDGVYFYVFKDASGKIVKSGSITLIR